MHAKEFKKQARALRKGGMAYHEIASKLNIPQSSVWYMCAGKRRRKKVTTTKLVERRNGGGTKFSNQLLEVLTSNLSNETKAAIFKALIK